MLSIEYVSNRNRELDFASCRKSLDSEFRQISGFVSGIDVGRDLAIPSDQGQCIRRQTKAEVVNVAEWVRR